MKNVIKLDHNKSYTDCFKNNNLLFIDEKYYNLDDLNDIDDLIKVFKTEKQYTEENSGIEFAQTHFGGKLAYIEDTHTFVVGGNIDDLIEQFYESDAIDDRPQYSTEDFEEFIFELSKITVEPFKIATVAWEENGICVYYIKYDKTFQSVRLDFDDWEETDLFKKIAKEYKFDVNSDDFYDDDEDHEDGSSPCHQICDKLYNQLLSELELLAPDWY